MAKKDVLKGRKVVGPNVFDQVNQSLDELKRNNPIVEYFKSRGVELKKQGNEYRGLCPFHDDKNPSLSVNAEKGFFYCFGCPAKGTVIDAVCYFDDVDTGEAIKRLQKRQSERPVPMVLKEKLPLKDREQSPGAVDLKPAVPKEPAEALINLDQVISYYHKKLYAHEAALSYLESRGLNDPALYSRFKVGYCEGSLLERLSENQKSALKTLHLINDYGYESFKGYVVFPLLDRSEKCAGLYGRSIDEKSRCPHLYLKGGHKGLFNPKAAGVYCRVILTESIIDALSLIKLGLDQVTACYGLNGFTDHHLTAFKEGRVKEVVIAFDRDKSGQKGAEALQSRLVNEGFQVRVICPLHEKDWNAALQKGLSKEAVLQQIEEAEVYGQEEKPPPFSVKEEKGSYYFTLNDLVYRLSGVKELFVNHLRVTVKISYGEDFFLDTVDLCSYRSRLGLCNHLCGLFEVEPKRVEKDLLKILDWLEEKRDQKLNPQAKDNLVLSEEEKEAGLNFLKNPLLFDEIESDLTRLGYVGERLNKLLIYLCACSRKLDDPISVMICSQSASGKSFLVDTVKKLIPPEEVMTITTLSDQALNYMEDLMHKFLVFGEAVHNDGIEHLIREMLSSRELSRWVTLKDDQSGRMVTKQVKKKVIVSTVMSTTSHSINAENASRFFMINTDESREQTRRIYSRQSEKNKLDRYREKSQILPGIIAKHHAAQRLLQKVVVVNDFAGLIDFPDHVMRLRRDHDRFLDLICVICFLRQYQKEVRQSEGTPYIECDLTDYELAYEIMVNGVLSSTLNELPGHAVSLYEEIRLIVEEKAAQEQLNPLEVSFTQRELREKTGLNQSHVKRCMRILVDYEYLKQKGSHSRGSRQSYSLMVNEKPEQLNLAMIPTVNEMQKRLT